MSESILSSPGIIIDGELPGGPVSTTAAAGYLPTADLSVLQKAFQRHGRLVVVTKRIIDVAVSATLLLVLSAPLATIAVILAAHLGGNPLFAHERIGHGGRPFKCLKFRTMREALPGEAEGLDPSFKTGTQNRTTRLTRWLRKASLDEVPQLVNVLLGQMSLVGPRPVVAQELTLHYGPLAPVLLAVKPGMTGLWAINGRSSLDYPLRAWMELKYATTVRLWLDAKILFRTVLVVLSRRGAL